MELVTSKKLDHIDFANWVVKNLDGSNVPTAEILQPLYGVKK